LKPSSRKLSLKEILALSDEERRQWWKTRNPDCIHNDEEVKLCSVEGCDKPVRHRSLCSGHYERWRRYKDVKPHIPLGRNVTAAVCMVPRCKKPHKAKGFCAAHYMNWKRCGNPLGLKSDVLWTHKPESIPRTCIICEKKHHAQGYCVKHYWRYKRNGEDHDDVDR
jgi:hypothetical protein